MNTGADGDCNVSRLHHEPIVTGVDRPVANSMQKSSVEDEEL